MNVSVDKLMEFIPEKMLDEIASETKVDKANTYKLQGKNLFRLLLYTLVEDDKVSLRVMEKVLFRKSFKLFYQGKPLKASRSGISDRLKVIPYEFFEKIFKTLSEKVSDVLPGKNKKSVVRFDSTIITLSSKLLKCGYPVAKGPNNQIKFSVGFKSIPTHCKIWSDKGFNSEEVALKEIIKSSSLSKDDIAVFDRGLNARRTLKEFSDQRINFVTRLNEKANYRILSVHSDVQGYETETLFLEEDVIVNLRSRDVHWVDAKFRMIRATHKETGKFYFFLTNMFDLAAEEITDIYKSRWDIEVFFKFIKQYLKAKHFVSRDLNGIKVYFYMILIVSALMLAFKALNKLEGLLMVKLDFREEFRNMVYEQGRLFYICYPTQFRVDFPC